MNANNATYSLFVAGGTHKSTTGLLTGLCISLLSKYVQSLASTTVGF